MKADDRAVRALVDLMVGIPKFSYPGKTKFSPKQKGQHAVVTFLSESQIGMSSQKVKDDTVEGEITYSTSTPIQMKYRVEFFEASELSHTMLTRWKSQDIINLMRASGYGILDVHPVVIESSEDVEEYEDRRATTVVLFYNRVFEETFSTIDGAFISGEYHDGSRVLTANIEINEV